MCLSVAVIFFWMLTAPAQAQGRSGTAKKAGLDIPDGPARQNLNGSARDALAGRQLAGLGPVPGSSIAHGYSTPSF